MGYEDVLDYYEFLDVKRNASTATIEAGYRRMSMKFHPDKDGNPRIFANLTQARDTLVDPAKRRAYDAWLEGGKGEPFYSAPPTPPPSQGPVFSRAVVYDTLIKVPVADSVRMENYLTNRYWPFALLAVFVSIFATTGPFAAPPHFWEEVALGSWAPLLIVNKKMAAWVFKMAKSHRETTALAEPNSNKTK